MASEIGLLSRRLLTCSIRSPYMRASQVVRQPLWTQPRCFSTSVVLNNSSPSNKNPFSAKKPSSSATSAQTPPPPPPSSSDAATPAEKQASSPFTYDATSDAFDISKIIAMESDEFLKKHYPTGQQEPELRTRPATGRTIHVGGNQDFSRAIKTLEMQVKRNKIKILWHRQKRHERPGLRRKRLKGERFKQRFKQGFVAAVKRVQELTNQGW